MKKNIKIGYSLFIALIFLIQLKGQKIENSIDWQTVYRLACPEIGTNPLFIFKIKDYQTEIKYSDSDTVFLQEIKTTWIKSIEVYKSSAYTDQLGEKGNNIVIIMTLKSRKWNKLSGQLKKELRDLE